MDYHYIGCSSDDAITASGSFAGSADSEASLDVAAPLAVVGNAGHSDGGSNTLLQGLLNDQANAADSIAVVHADDDGSVWLSSS